MVRDARLGVLAESARTPGFARAAGRLFSELQRALIDPGRLTAGLRRWAEEEGAGRAAYAEDVAALYAAYVRRLEAFGPGRSRGLRLGRARRAARRSVELGRPARSSSTASTT